MNGLLVVDKPAGSTSHDVVARTRRLYGLRRVGHAGTLDPPATGVLLVGLGRATRILTFLSALPKTYHATIRFGITTTTQDFTGEVVEERALTFDEADLHREAESFVGEILQTPPMVSAVKVGGERLYRRARRGEEVDRPARPVFVYTFEVKGFDPGSATAEVYVKCSSGTYVRTLAADLGEGLGCGAHLVKLRRSAIGSFTEKEAIDLDALLTMDRQDRAGVLLSMREALRDFPSVIVKGDEVEAVVHGRPLGAGVRPARDKELPVMAAGGPGGRPPHEAGMVSGVPVAVLDDGGNVLAVYRQSREGLRPAAVLEAR